MNVLHSYLLKLSAEDRAALARASDTSLGHLYNVAYGCKPCGPKLAIGLERSTRGLLRVEELCPSLDWAVVRGRARRRRLNKRGRD